MSTALQFHSLPITHPQIPGESPKLWAAVGATQRKPIAAAVALMQKRPDPIEVDTAPKQKAETITSYAFYRKHTESMLRRYLYASMQVGRSPSLLGESIGRGWVSSRRVHTFEDAVIFVLDIEKCIDKLSTLDRQMLSRIVLQEYTHSEAAGLIGISARTICTRFPQALDRLTELLVDAELLIIPE